MFNIVDINNSFSYIETNIPDMYSKIMQQLTFSVPNAQFTPSYRDGTWNGLKTFYRVYNNVLIVPKGIAPLVIQKFKQYNPIYNPLNLNEYKLPTFIEFTQFVKNLNIGFEPYDYQLQAAYDSICKKRQTNLLATSAGKSLVIYLITKWLYKHNIKTVLIFPSIMLTSQIHKDFTDYSNLKYLYKLKEKYEKHWDKSLSQENLIEVQNEILQKEQFLLDIHLIGGDNNIKHFDLPITATTWQSVYDNPDLFKDVQAVIIDECLHPSTLIKTDKGLIPIKYLNIGDNVLTFNESTDMYEYKPIVKVHKNISKEQQMFKITTENGKELLITGNHKVLLSTKKWVRVDKLQEGDDIIDENIKFKGDNKYE